MEGQAQAIILLEAHLLMRLALQHVVTGFAHMHITASLGTIDTVLPFTNKTEGPLTVVIGPSVSISDCLKLLRWRHELHANWGMVVIQQDIQPETVHTLLKQGVHALLDENASEQDLEQAIRAASLGNTFLNRRVRSIRAMSTGKATNDLTAREIQVLSHLKHGESNFRIAHGLGLKEKTIEKYLTNIYDKLNVRSRTEAILYLQKSHF